MRRSVTAAVAAAAALFASSLALAPSAGAAPSPTGAGHRNTAVCAKDVAGVASCDAVRHDTLDASGRPDAAATTTPSGYGPADIRSAYKLPAATGTPTVAIVDAYDDPNAEA